MPVCSVYSWVLSDETNTRGIYKKVPIPKDRVKATHCKSELMKILELFTQTGSLIPILK